MRSGWSQNNPLQHELPFYVRFIKPAPMPPPPPHSLRNTVLHWGLYQILSLYALIWLDALQDTTQQESFFLSIGLHCKLQYNAHLVKRRERDVSHGQQSSEWLTTEASGRRRSTAALTPVLTTSPASSTIDTFTTQIHRQQYACIWLNTNTHGPMYVATGHI